MPHIYIWITCFLFISTITLWDCFFRSNILFIIKHRLTFFYAELNPKIIRRIVNMGIKGYGQLVDIVNFCGKQHNISPSKKTHGSDLLSVAK